MAKNQALATDRIIYIAVASGVKSGDTVVIGGLVGVALIDRDASGNATVDFGGCYNLSVKGADDAGNVAVAVGDPIYYVDADTPKLSKKSSGILFGFALDAVTSGSTTTIRVMSAPPTARQRTWLSAEQTGTGSSQNVAHPLGVVPKQVLVVPTDTSPSTTGAYTETDGTHTSTNVVVTVTSGKKFKVLAIA